MIFDSIRWHIRKLLSSSQDNNKKNGRLVQFASRTTQCGSGFGVDKKRELHRQAELRRPGRPWRGRIDEGKGRKGNPGLAKGAGVLYRCRLGRTKVRTNDKRKDYLSEVYVVLIRLSWAQHATMPRYSPRLVSVFTMHQTAHMLPKSSIVHHTQSLLGSLGFLIRSP